MIDLSFVACCPWAGQQQVTIYAKTLRGAELCEAIFGADWRAYAHYGRLSVTMPEAETLIDAALDAGLDIEGVH
jgi:hypothetical protein